MENDELRMKKKWKSMSGPQTGLELNINKEISIK